MRADEARSTIVYMCCEINTVNHESKVLIVGVRGMVGSALVRRLNSLGYSNVLTPVREELDLLKQQDVFDYLARTMPDYIFIAPSSSTKI